MYQRKRETNRLPCCGAGLAPLCPDGSYFILFLDTSSLPIQVSAGQRRDVAVCRWLTSEIGVAAIPPSPFYSTAHQHLTDNLARFTFCKTDEMLDEAVRRLGGLSVAVHQ